MSEKPMTELLRKSGIIERHITEFEKWRLIDPNFEGPMGSTVPRTADQMVGDLVGEIAELLDKEPVMRQTVLSVKVKAPPRLWCGEKVSFHAIKDEIGHLIADVKTKIYRGDIIWCEDSTHENFTVLEVEDLYEDNAVVAKMITIEKDN